MQEWNNNLEFWINGEKRNLNNVDVNTTLLEHLRINEELTGKFLHNKPLLQKYKIIQFESRDQEILWTRR